MEMDEVLPLHNTCWTAVHELAFGCTPKQQCSPYIILDYANSLPEYTADKLNRRISHKDSHIKTLYDTMEEAEIIYQQYR